MFRSNSELAEEFHNGNFRRSIFTIGFQGGNKQGDENRTLSQGSFLNISLNPSQPSLHLHFGLFYTIILVLLLVDISIPNMKSVGIPYLIKFVFFRLYENYIGFWFLLKVLCFSHSIICKKCDKRVTKRQ